MRIVLFYHSLLSDWNHGNAHFLRGIVAELLSRDHDVRVFEPLGGWSFTHQLQERGESWRKEFGTRYPGLKSTFYDPANLELDHALDGADLVIVHEWNPLALIRRIGEYRTRNRGFHLLFHDTHHRVVTAEPWVPARDLSGYDGVLAFGAALRDFYQASGIERVWTWHEAADVRVFRPLKEQELQGDLVWIGNWGDDERTEELQEFLLRPAKALKLKSRVYGVRYPDHALRSLAQSGIEYGGWLPNYRVPETFAAFRTTIHVPRRPYTRMLPGIPTIRVFEALACGIPLVSAPWDDVEHLFSPGEDFLVARNGQEMQKHLSALLSDPQMARKIADHGRATILARHTCAHRVDQLLNICQSIGMRVTQTMEVRA